MSSATATLERRRGWSRGSSGPRHSKATVATVRYAHRQCNSTSNGNISFALFLSRKGAHTACHRVYDLAAWGLAYSREVLRGGAGTAKEAALLVVSVRRWYGELRGSSSSAPCLARRVAAGEGAQHITRWTCAAVFAFCPYTCGIRWGQEEAARGARPKVTIADVGERANGELARFHTCVVVCTNLGNSPATSPAKRAVG